MPFPKNKSFKNFSLQSIDKFTKKFFINNWSIPLKTRFKSEFQAQKFFKTNKLMKIYGLKRNHYKNLKIVF